MGSIKKAFKKVLGVKRDVDQSAAGATVPAPELGFVDADQQATTEEESEKQQLTKGKKKGKKSLKINMAGSSGAGRNIV